MGPELVNATVSNLKQFELPAIPSLIPFECHPDCQTDKLKFIDMKLPWFTSMTLPREQDDERMVLAVLTTVLFFVLDDILESSTVETAKQFQEAGAKIAEGAPVSSFGQSQDPMLLLYHEVMCKFREMMTPSLYSHFLRCIKSFFSASLEEVVHGKRACIPSPEEFKFLRRKTGFAEAVTAVFCEFVMGLELSNSDKQSAAYNDLVAEVIDHCLLVNDLFSFKKEYYSLKSHNWLSVLLHARQDPRFGFQDAVYEVLGMIQETEVRILQLQKKLAEQAISNNVDNGHLVKFAEAIPLAASGNLRWSFCTSRYHGFKNPLVNNQPFHGTWIMHPERTIILPPKPRPIASNKTFYRTAFKPPQPPAAPRPSFSVLSLL